MVPGTKIDLGGREYVLPPLSLGQLRNGAMEKIKEHDKYVEEGDWLNVMLVRGALIAEALSRNYDTTELAAATESLDMHNVNEAWSIVTGVTFGDSVGAASGPLATTSGPSTAP